MALLTATQLRTHLNWPASRGTTDNAELEAMGGQAQGIISDHIARPIGVIAITAEQHHPGRSILLHEVPCACSECLPHRALTISAVRVDGTAVASTDYVLDTARGALLRTSGYGWTASKPLGIEVDYSAGYSTAPPWLVLAISRMVEHLWGRTQAARHSRNADTTGEGAPAPQAAFLLPYMVQSLVEGHARGVPVA